MALRTPLRTPPRLGTYRPRRAAPGHTLSELFPAIYARAGVPPTQQPELCSITCRSIRCMHPRSFSPPGDGTVKVKQLPGVVGLSRWQMASEAKRQESGVYAWPLVYSLRPFIQVRGCGLTELKVTVRSVSLTSRYAYLCKPS